MRKKFWIITDKQNKIGRVKTALSYPSGQYIFEKKGEAKYYALEWDGDVVKKATLSWE